MTAEIELYDPKKYIALGEVMAKSGFFRDTRDAGQAAVKIIAGQELGIPPVAAMRGLHIVEGKVELSGTMIGALIKRHPDYDYRVTEHTDERCTVQFRQGSEVIGETTWTLDNAVRAGLCELRDGKPYARSRDGKKKPWETYTRAMLFNRAMSEGARTHVPDVFGGAVYSEGEISGELEPEPAETVPTPKKQETSPPVDGTADVVEGELVEEGDGPDQKATVEGAESEPPPSSPQESAGESESPPPNPPREGAEAVPPADIPVLIEQLGWNAGRTLKFAREHVGKHLVRPNWSALSAEDAAALAAALRKELSK